MGAVADPGGPGARAPLAPKISSKSCSFQANFRLRAPPWGSKLHWAPLTKILDPRLGCNSGVSGLSSSCVVLASAAGAGGTKTLLVQSASMHTRRDARSEAN